ncbi:unnamed protein product [Citrullus colocynthis]|uniref:Uncharacterized protein n=1 Tax=Citrullus colocynthis TaxID=252529 RepID=A0ABP0XPL3_9ROSI
MMFGLLIEFDVVGAYPLISLTRFPRFSSLSHTILETLPTFLGPRFSLSYLQRSEKYQRIHSTVFFFFNIYISLLLAL